MISRCPESSRAGPRLASPYYHFGRYRREPRSVVLLLPLGMVLASYVLMRMEVVGLRMVGKLDYTPLANEVTRQRINRPFQVEPGISD